MTSVLTEANGAQVMPDIRDERKTVSAWHAHCAADADQRTKYPEYAALAGRLFPILLEPEADR